MPMPTGEPTLQEQALMGQQLVAEPTPLPVETQAPPQAIAPTPMQPQQAPVAQQPMPMPQQQPVNLDGSPNVLYQPPAPVVDPVTADLTQQLAVAQEQAKPAGFGEKLATGLLNLPGLRQTVGRVAEPFMPDREEAQKRVENITGQLQSVGEAQSGLEFLKQFSPGIYTKAMQLSGPMQAAFVKNAVERISQGNTLERFKFDKEQAALDEKYRWAALRERLAAQGIDRQTRMDKADDAQYFKDENEVRMAQQRAIASARTSPYITRLMTAKVGADDVHALLLASTNQGPDGKIVLNAPSVGEVMASLQRTLSMGGQSSVEMLKEITPQSLHRDVAKMKEWVTGNPQAVLTPQQFKNLMAVSERQIQFLGDKLQVFYKAVGHTLEPVFKRDAARSPDGQSYLKKVFDQGLEDVAMETIGEASAPKTVVKKQKNKKTGEMRVVYSDGSVEVVNE